MQHIHFPRKADGINSAIRVASVVLNQLQHVCPTEALDGLCVPVACRLTARHKARSQRPADGGSGKACMPLRLDPIRSSSLGSTSSIIQIYIFLYNCQQPFARRGLIRSPSSRVACPSKSAYRRYRCYLQSTNTRARREVSITRRILLSNAFVEGLLLLAWYSQNSIVLSLATVIPLNLYQGRPKIVAKCPSMACVD